MIGHSSCLCHAKLRELTNTYQQYMWNQLVVTHNTYCNSIPDVKFFFWFEKSKLTSHLIHILQMAYQLISHRQDAL